MALLLEVRETDTSGSQNGLHKFLRDGGFSLTAGNCPIVHFELVSAYLDCPLEFPLDLSLSILPQYWSYRCAHSMYSMCCCIVSGITVRASVCAGHCRMS